MRVPDVLGAIKEEPGCLDGKFLDVAADQSRVGSDIKDFRSSGVGLASGRKRTLASCGLVPGVAHVMAYNVEYVEKDIGSDSKSHSGERIKILQEVVHSSKEAIVNDKRILY